MSARNMNCCAIKEFYNLSQYPLTPEGRQAFLDATFRELIDKGHYEEHYDWTTDIARRGKWVPTVYHTPAFIIFSQAGSGEDVAAAGAYGDYFHEWVKEQELGTVVVTEPALNENSKNLVKVFLWTVDQPKFLALLKTYYKENKDE